MASISHGVVLTTAMLVSTTVLYLAFSRQKSSTLLQISHTPNKQILRSCLYSDEKKRKRKKKKRVKFSEKVMVKEVKVEKIYYEENRGGEEQRKQKNRASSAQNCRNETGESRMPANRVALYNGILRDRGHKMACCH